MTVQEPDNSNFPVKTLNVVEVENPPVVVENGKSCLSLISSDDDEDDDVNCYDNDITTPTKHPIVNVVNCSDVVIGSVTQYHGPVTIVQHAHSPQLADSINEKEEDKINEANLVPSKDDSDENGSRRRKKIIWYFCITFTLFLAFTITLSVIFTTGTNVVVQSGNHTERDFVIPNHVYINRSMWGGRDPLYVVPMTHPAEYVIISHTAGNQCQTIAECCAVMRSIQDYHVSIGSPDVGYNFVIGGDGNIYEGRGWDTKNFHEDKSVGVNFSGNYIYDELTASMKDALEKLLEVGVDMEVIASDYKLVAHNQTFATLSPGKNIYDYICTLPHFFPNRTI